MNKRSLIAALLISLFGILSAGAIIVEAQSGLTIEPQGGTYQINTVVQFQALHDGQDVTDQADWSISGSFTNSPKRGELLAPGRFRLLLGGNDIYVTARYQGERANTIITVQGGSGTGRTGFAPLDQNLNVGESITLKYFRGEQVFCQNPPCAGSTMEVSGQWASMNPEALESLGGGLFRAKGEGYAAARIAPFDGVPSSAQTYIGIVDPTKPYDASFDVSLANRHPVYTWIDARYHDGSGYGPFTNIDFIPDSGSGRFAVVGECADGRDVSAPGIGSSHQVELEDGGLNVFSEDGKFVAQGDACHDTMVPTGCYEIGGCTIGKDMSPIGNGRFILDTGNSSGRANLRSPLLYGISGASVSRDNRLFFTNSIPSNARASSVKELVEFNQIASANGVMVGVGLESTATNHARIPGFPGPTIPFERKNIFFSVPEFQKLGESKIPTTCPASSCSGSPYVTQPEYNPVFGLGEYFVAVEGNRRAIGPFDVYRMPSRQALQSGERPQKVGEMDLGFRGMGGFTYDAMDPNRVIVTGLTGSRDGGVPYVIYKAGSDGLMEDGSGELDTATITGYNVALRGEYIAYTSCKKISGTHPVLNTLSTANCELVVEKDGDKLSVEPLPLNVFFPRSYGSMPGVAISPSGRVLVSAHNAVGRYGENDNLYLYQINGIAPPPPGTGNPTFPPPGDGGTTPPPDQSIIGQSLNLTFEATAPQALIRFASVLGATPQGLSISVFGKTFEVYTAGARILNRNWAPTTIQEILASPFVNIWGNLDTASSTIIQGITVRNPLPANVQSNPQATVAPQSTAAPAPVTNAAAQSTLDSLRQILQGLQSQVGQ